MAQFIYVVLALTVLIAVSIAVPLEGNNEAEPYLRYLLVKRKLKDADVFTKEKRKLRDADVFTEVKRILTNAEELEEEETSEETICVTVTAITNGGWPKNRK